MSDGECVPMSAGVRRGQRLKVPGAEVTKGWELPDGMLGTELGSSTKTVCILSH